MESRTSTATELATTSFANGPMEPQDTHPSSFSSNAKDKRESKQSFLLEETDIPFQPLPRTATSSLFLVTSPARLDQRRSSLFKPKDAFFFVFPFL